MNDRQARALELMRADPQSIGYHKRDLYEGASAWDPKRGSGEYWITYTAGHEYDPLTKQDVDDLETAGLIKESWPGCYELSAGGRP